jgi:hypothetical protein
MNPSFIRLWSLFTNQVVWTGLAKFVHGGAGDSSRSSIDLYLLYTYISDVHKRKEAIVREWQKGVHAKGVTELSRFRLWYRKELL